MPIAAPAIAAIKNPKSPRSIVFPSIIYADDVEIILTRACSVRSGDGKMTEEATYTAASFHRIRKRINPRMKPDDVLVLGINRLIGNHSSDSPGAITV